MRKNKAEPRRRPGDPFSSPRPYVVWMTVFILIPLGVVVFYALTDPATGMFSCIIWAKFLPGPFPGFSAAPFGTP